MAFFLPEVPRDLKPRALWDFLIAIKKKIEVWTGPSNNRVLEYQDVYKTPFVTAASGAIPVSAIDGSVHYISEADGDLYLPSVGLEYDGHRLVVTNLGTASLTINGPIGYDGGLYDNITVETQYGILDLVWNNPAKIWIVNSSTSHIYGAIRDEAGDYILDEGGYTVYDESGTGTHEISDSFIFKVQTSGSSDTFTLPLVSTGVYDFNVNWGDGSNDNITVYDQEEITHTYAVEDEYRVIISGVFIGIGFNESSDGAMITEISNWGRLRLGNAGSYFYGCSNMTIEATDTLDFSGARDFSLAFALCSDFPDITSLDTTSATDMSYMFLGTEFNQDIGDWDTSNVTTMKGMFQNDTAFNQDISGWDVSSVAGDGFEYMFDGASVFNQDIGEWTLGPASSARYMFRSAVEFDQDLSGWDISNLEHLDGMFYGVSLSETNYDLLLNGWAAQAPSIQSNVVFSAGNSTYSADGMDARGVLTDDYNWTITDAGNSSFVMEYSFSAGQSLVLPLVSAGTYDFNVDWGDGTEDTITAYDQAERVHLYSTTDTFIVAIKGTIEGWSFYDSVVNNGVANTSNYALKDIISFGSLRITGMGAFYYCINSSGDTVSATDVINTTGATDLSYMFMGCNYLPASVPSIVSMDISSCENFSHMFENCWYFNTDISGWDTSSATSMEAMFSNAGTFNQDLDGWDVSNVTTMAAMFYHTGIAYDLNSWDVSNVTDMSLMFSSSPAFNHNITSWDVSNVTNMYRMFGGGGPLYFNQDISGWDVSSVTNMQEMFNYNFSFNQDISEWDVSNVTNMQGMFQTARAFNQDIGDWDTAKVTTMYGMFYGAIAFNKDIGEWDTSEVTTMARMFYEANAFNQDIGDWDTAKVTTMDRMFGGSSIIFDQDISGWNIGSITTLANMFIYNDGLSQANYEALLIAWAAQAPNIQSNVIFSAGTPNYASGGAAAAARAVLTGAPYNWTIYDGGAV